MLRKTERERSKPEQGPEAPRIRCPHCRNTLLQKGGADGSLRVRASGVIEVRGDGVVTAQCYWCKSAVELPLQLRDDGSAVDGERFILVETVKRPV